jgi:hypothetical protein
MAITVRLEIGRRTWPLLLRDSARAFAGIGCECRDVDQADDVRVIARFSDDRTAIRMTDEQHRPVLLRDHLSRPLDVIGERRQRHFHCMDRRVALASQFNNDFAPMGRATPKTMYSRMEGCFQENSPGNAVCDAPVVQMPAQQIAHRVAAHRSAPRRPWMGPASRCVRVARRSAGTGVRVTARESGSSAASVMAGVFHDVCAGCVELANCDLASTRHLDR